MVELEKSKQKSKKHEYVGYGILVIAFGISILVNPKGFDLKYGVYFDFSEIKWLFGGSIIAYGCLMVWSDIRKDIQFFNWKILGYSFRLIIIVAGVFGASIFIAFVFLNILAI